ncbi:MAG: hypothetical protein QF830_07715 [Rhodospirillales bacterium]|jgi:phosphotriesterase-related protein|nr:hypothetical protein [Rhodospirillales bacterium]MDP6884007.1 hypothetical protein [Rhodospirillales bacterium]
MSELRGKVQTVRGLIEPKELGPTLMHEHVVCDFTLPAQRAAADEAAEITLETVWEINYHWVDAPGNRRLLDRDVAVREMTRMVEAGGRSVVEVSTRPMILDPEGLRLVSERSGAHLVRGCGRYLEEFMDADEMERGVDDLAAEIVADVTEGSAPRAGIIGEIGCSWPWTEAERRSMQAAVIAQQETGAALTIHPGRHPDAPFEIMAFVKSAGADISRTVMDHTERRLFDIADILRLADTGCVVEFDLFGMETSHFAQARDVDLSGDGARLTAIRALIDAGHGDRVVISHDICQRTRQVEFGGHGYGHIYRNIVPMMRRRDFGEDEIDAILVDTPARLLTFK